MLAFNQCFLYRQFKDIFFNIHHSKAFHPICHRIPQHIIQHNLVFFYHFILFKNRCLNCGLVLNFGFLVFYFKLFGTFLYVRDFWSKLIECHCIPYNKCFHFYVSYHNTQISQHCIKILCISFNSHTMVWHEFVKGMHDMTEQEIAQTGITLYSTMTLNLSI